MVPFAGWDMPVEFSGISLEHMAVRTAGGLFDLSHMGQIEIAGKDALVALQWLTCNDASLLEIGEAQYSALTTPAGTFVDDVQVYRIGSSHFMLVVNAANVDKDVAWIVEHVSHLGDVITLDNSSRYALLALQGPAATDVMKRVAKYDPSGMKYYGFSHGEVAGVRATLSRTGSTGEDGYEVFVPPKQAPVVWNAILEAGQDDGIVPAGLGARDTLRLEAAMRLYGNEINAETTVLEADLERLIAWEKGDFIGRDHLTRQKEAGVARRLIGFEMTDRAIAGHGDPVMIGGQKAGVVTSGAQTPFLEKSIGMAYVPASHAAEGEEFDVEISGQLSRARVVRLPFYTRAKG